MGQNPSGGYGPSVGGSSSGGSISTCGTTNALAEYTAATTVGCGAGDFTYATHTLTMGASGLVNLGGGAWNSFTVPKVATGSIGTATDGIFFFNSSNQFYQMGETGNGNFVVAAAGSQSTPFTDCSLTNQLIKEIGGTFAPICESLSTVLASDYTNATTGQTTITGFSFPLVANQNYAISCKLIYQGSASTAGMILSSTGPASPTKVTAQTLMDTTAGAGSVVFTQATDGATFGFTVGAASIVTTATDLYSTVDIGVRNGANAGTFQLTAASSGAGTITIKQGSYCTGQ